MKTYILDSINRLKRYGENLDVKTILCNKSWQIFNDSGEKGAPDKPCGEDARMLTQKTVAKRYMIEKKSIPLHHES